MGEYIYKQLETRLTGDEIEAGEIPRESIDALEALRQQRQQYFSRDEIQRSFRDATGVDLRPPSREELFAIAQRNGWSAGLNPETMTPEQWNALMTRLTSTYSGLTNALNTWGQGTGWGSSTGRYNAPTVEEFLRNFTTADGAGARLTPEQWEAIMRQRRGDVTR